jgi:putative tryptophan/tyrosine transport system substrate-binding protein
VRRLVVAFLSLALLAAPLATDGQPAMPVIGFFSLTSAEATRAQVAAFDRGLKEGGYVEGENVAIEYRFAGNQLDRLAPMAAELARRPVAVIVAAGGDVGAVAAKSATSTIPIVFTAAADPVKGGLVASLNRPGGNVTGIGALTIELDAKRLELLNELVPSAAIGALVNPSRPDADAQLRGVHTAARALGRRLVVVSAQAERDLEPAFAALVQQRLGALLIGADPFFFSRRVQIVALAARHAIPAIYQSREFADAGGLVSYGASITDAYRQAGLYAGRILKGEKPADLPVQQPTRFELVINLKTAKALGLTIPQSVLLRADEIIQ